MKTILIFLTLIFSPISFGHEDHANSHVSDTSWITAPRKDVIPRERPKHGGVLRDVTEYEGKNTFYKAELVRMKDAVLKLYIYDLKMNKVDPATLSGLDGKVMYPKAKKWGMFSLTQEGDHLTTQVKGLALTVKPYNVQIVFMRKDKNYHVDFSNLD